MKYIFKGRLVMVAAFLIITSMVAGYGFTAAEGESVTVEDGEVLEIRSFGSELRYDITEIEAVAGTELTLKYINEGTMPHNILLVYGEEDINPVGIAALRARDTEYVPQEEMDRIIDYTAMAGPRDTVEVTFTVPEPGTYPYICTYPGHYRSMQGRLHSVAE